MDNTQRDHDITTYERHLWRVLAVLARAGYFVPPQDARDLIHDFYFDQWDGLLLRYDSDRSQFATYVSAAFYRFARRRILALQRWRLRTVDLDDAGELASTAPAPDQQLESSERIALIRARLASLPALERAVLFDFLAGDDANERSLARRHSLTRYGLREVLANALGRLMVALAADEAAPTLEAQVAKSLWIDSLSPRHVARLHGIGTAEVNTARWRFVAELIKSLRQFNHPPKPARKTMDTATEILKSALFAVGDDAALARVRDHAAVLLAALADDDLDLSINQQQAQFLEANARWVGEVYDAIGVDDSEATQPSELQCAIADLMLDEAQQIGDAFSALAESLAERGYRWTHRFEGLKPSGPELMHLIDEPTLRDGGAAASTLFEFGLTPGMIYGATRGLCLLFSRISRALAAGTTLAPQMAERTGASFCIVGDALELVFLPHALACAAVAGTPDLPAQAVEPLLAWIKDVLPLSPWLIEGYTWEDSAGGIELMLPVVQRAPDLVAQWLQQGSTVPPAHDYAAAAVRKLADA
ncbi:RNA polymerase sigma factor [Massilia sp. TWR1-2-2]|uniref:RNA polymerase sigma factor n=1 Tax=Massilia sp. TWR1-2-2 TaxID=2804584 RepID=UPI003CF23216